MINNLLPALLKDSTVPLFAVSEGELLGCNPAFEAFVHTVLGLKKLPKLLAEDAFLGRLWLDILPHGHQVTSAAPDGCIYSAGAMPLTIQGREAFLVSLSQIPQSERQAPAAAAPSFADLLLDHIFPCREPQQALREVLGLLAEHYKAGRICVNCEHSSSAGGAAEFEQICSVPGPGRRVIFKPPQQQIIIYLEHKRRYSQEHFTQPIAFKSLEEAQSDPVILSFMQETRLENFIYCPLHCEAGEKANLCLGNLDKLSFADALQHLDLIARIIAFLLDFGDTLKECERLSMRDELTHVKNRRAFEEYARTWSFSQSAACLVCDVIDLKAINKRRGYDYGDQVLKTTASALVSMCRGLDVFRWGSDNFICVVSDLPEEDFAQCCIRLRALLGSLGFETALGQYWTDEKCTVQYLVDSAQRSLNVELSKSGGRGSDKPSRLLDHIAQDECPGKQRWRQKAQLHESADPFYQYLGSNYYDALSVIKSLSAVGLPVFLVFGDLKSRQYYISDSLRDTFGFSSNLVQDFIVKFVALMPREEDRRMILGIVADLEHSDLNQDCAFRRHSLRCRAMTSAGEEIWLHCFGFTTYDSASGQAVFFSGFGLRLDDAYVVDKVTNLPGEFAAQADISRRLASNEETKIFALSLNRMPEIFDAIGRDAAQKLLGEIAAHAVQAFARLADFYHFGQRTFIAIEKHHAIKDSRRFAERWLKTVGECYEKMGFNGRHAASVCQLFCPRDILSANDALDKIAYFTVISKENPEDFILLNENKLYEQRYQTKLLFELTSAVENDFADFSTLVQPIVDARDHRIRGAEILLRFSSGGKLQSPALFIPALERSELIIEVGRYVFEEAARFVSEVRKNLPDFYISFNVSYVQVRDDADFIDFMREVLTRHALPGEAFVVELTETNFDSYPERLAEFLTRCHELKMRFALDDFGNGYSSLHLLLRYPVDVVKLDRSLTEKLAGSADILNFMRSVIYACHGFGKKVVVEGVETSAELKAISEIGADSIQGYYFYRPMLQHEAAARVLEECAAGCV